MDCRETLRNLELLVLDGLTDEQTADAEAHLATCPSCRAAEEDCGLAVTEIKLGAETPAPKPAYQGALRAAVASEIRSERRRFHIRRVAAAAGSLAAMLLLGLALWGILKPEGAGGGPAAVTSDGARTGGRDAAPAPHLREKWRYAGARAAIASPADDIVVRGSSMYLISNGEAAGRVVAVDVATGKARWRSKSRSFGYLAADRSRVFCLSAVSGREVELLALSAVDGSRLWHYSQNVRWNSLRPCRPVPLPGNRVCWTVGAEMHMLDAGTGRKLWTRSFVNEGPPSCAAAGEGDVYVATANRIQCLRADSGEVSWTKEFGDDRAFPGRPLLALAERRAYLVQTGSIQGSRVLCIDTERRELVWKKDVSWVRSMLATPEGLYLRGQRIIAMSGQTGDLLWSRAAGGCGPVSVVGGVLHFVDMSEQGRLVALEPRTGRLAGEISGIRSCDAFTGAGDTGYIKTQDGVVHAIALAETG